MTLSNYDIIFVSGFRTLGISAMLVAKFFGKGCILKADSSGEMSGEFFVDGLRRLHLSLSFLPIRIFFFFRNWLYKQADFFVAIYSEIESELKKYIDTKKIIQIPNGIDTKKFFPVTEYEKMNLRRKLGLPLNKTIIIYTGRLVSYKGPLLLIKVWEKIALNYPEAYLVFVGSGGSDIHNCESEIRIFVETEGLSNTVHFTGDVHIDSVKEYLQASDFYAFPSTVGGVAISLTEAMACGLPVIVTVKSGSNVVVNGKNGIVIDVNGFKGLYNAIETLLKDKTLVVSMRKESRKIIEKKYSIERTATNYIELFCSI